MIKILNAFKLRSNELTHADGDGCRCHGMRLFDLLREPHVDFKLRRSVRVSQNFQNAMNDYKCQSIFNCRKRK